jgi:hypothetical protein
MLQDTTERVCENVFWVPTDFLEELGVDSDPGGAGE